MGKITVFVCNDDNVACNDVFLWSITDKGLTKDDQIGATSITMVVDIEEMAKTASRLIVNKIRMKQAYGRVTIKRI